MATAEAPRATSAPDIGLAAWFARRATATPERRALTFEGTTLTFAELESRMGRLAAALRAGGVERGDRVAFLGLNQPAFLETMFATVRLGAVFVPLNFRLTGPELAYVVSDAGARTLVVDADHREVIEGARDELAVERYLAVDFTGEGWEAVSDAVAGAPTAEAPERTEPDDPAVIMYTSGTTGRPKGATLTHGNLWWNNVNAVFTIDVAYDDVTLTVAPLYHIGGMNVITLVTWLKGGEVVLHRGFDPAATLAAIIEHRVTTLFAVPAMFQFLAAHPDFEDADLSSVRVMICGGAPLPEGLIRTYHERDIDLLQGYGLTETAPMCSFLTAEHALDKVGSAGRPPPFCELALRNADGLFVEEPEGRGEICVRGPNVMSGYWNDPDATAEAIDAEGWFHTGDGGYRDAEGFYYVVDRVKDMVITGGENVYPAEVEGVLFDHAAVAEVAVIGTPDERWGEAVCAVVALAEGSEAPDLEELREFAGERLARYKLPRRVEVVDELPRNPTGKVLKRELRERFP